MPAGLPASLSLSFFSTTSLKVANEKIRHLEAVAELREKEASSMRDGASVARERADAHERALASALEQVGHRTILKEEMNF